MFKKTVQGEPFLDIVKIIDFGLCANLLDKSEDSLLNDKSGTVGYLAPELIGMTKQTGFYDDKVDVFSAGVVFYEMLTGKNPFKSKTYKQSMNLNYKCELSIETLNLSKSTKLFLKKITSRDPKPRFDADNA